MNNGIYRLVFNKSRGLWMAVSEHVRSHQSGKSSSGKSKLNANINNSGPDKGSVSVFILLLGGLGVFGIASADPILPVNTIPTGLVYNPAQVTIHPPEVIANINVLKIDQSSLKSILTGTNFDIGNASAVNFNHTGGAGSATLIRITGAKSIIEGALNSPNGAIYLINQNGILFGNGARVDVNGLVASALDIKDSDFLSNLGHLNAYVDGGRAAYVWGGNAAGFQEVLVQVAPDAQIKAALGSSVMLFAPKVINQGSIHTTEGQVAMAAGDKVYLSFAPDLNGGTAPGIYNYTEDSPYRGLAGVLVEVDSPGYTKKDANGNDVLDTNNNPVELTGEVVNDTMGRILAQRGNVTMASFLVNQNGRVTATSSTAQKGSVRLLARDTNAVGFASIEPSGNEGQLDFVTRMSQNNTTNTIISGRRTGKLELGENSITAVLAEDSAALAKTREVFSAPQAGEPVAKAGEKSYVESVINAVNVTGSTIADEQVFNAPTIEAVGRQVIIGDNAKVVAPGGYIDIAAQKSGIGFNFGALNAKDSESGLFLGKNTLIDAAGLKNVAVDMERNFVEVLLTLTDLKDNPLNRDGFLYREKVWFDIRNTPDSRVADLSGFVKQVPRSLGEKLATAGDVKLRSEGDLIQNSSSKVDVSGGSLRFDAGLNKESWVVAQNGKAYALGDAPVDSLFTGFLGATNSRGRQEAGYTEGKAAGTLSIEAYDIALDGQLSGGATYGIHQRESKNLGGHLAVKVMTEIGVSEHDVNIGNTTPLSVGFSASDALPVSRIDTVEIDAGMISRSGFEDVAIDTTANIKVNAALKMADGAKLALSGRDVEVNKDIVSRGGNISLTSAFTEGSVIADDKNIKVADGVTLDVSGNWVNDRLSGIATGRVLTDGGQVSISSGDEVKLGSGSLVDVSGGGWLQGNGNLVKGDAGSINIASQVGQGSQDNPYTYIAPELKGELRGFALGTGGTLSITAPFITIGNTGNVFARNFLQDQNAVQDLFFNPQTQSSVIQNILTKVLTRNDLKKDLFSHISGNDLSESPEFLSANQEIQSQLILNFLAISSPQRDQVYLNILTQHDLFQNIFDGVQIQPNLVQNLFADLQVLPSYAQDSGFTSFNLTGRDGVLVRGDTQVDVIAKNYFLDRDYVLKATGSHVNDFATTVTLPAHMRSSTSIALSSLATDVTQPATAFVPSGVARGSVVVETGAKIKVDANGVRTDAEGKASLPSIALSAWSNQLYVDGTLEAPGGNISLTMLGDPSSTEDPGYNDSQAIWLGANAKLLAAGYTRLTPTANGLRAGNVYDGGSIALDAKKGYVIAESGSVLDVSGTSAILDVKNINRITPTRITSNGGDISISAREGMLLDSTLKASSPGGLGGSFELRFTRGVTRNLGLLSADYPGTIPNVDVGNLGRLPDQLWYVDLSQSGTFVPNTLNAGDAIETSAAGLAKVSVDKIASAGFSDVALKSEHGVRFTGDVDLDASRSLTINAKVVEGTGTSTVTLSAPNVVIANDLDIKPLRPNNEYQAATPVAGSANLIVNSELLDLKGQFALSRFAATTLNSNGEIRMTGVSDPNVSVGGLNQPPVGKMITTGELNFNARQIYPTSLSDFTVTVNGAGSKVSFNKIDPNGSYDKVLSAGGKLTVNAETIDQNGVLLAPFGTIALNASDTLILNEDSVTSVSAQGAIIPFGYTDRDGLDFLYDFGPNSQLFTAPPERVVKLNAPNINQETGSTVDVSGGGDLFAYEWVPGIGGSSDVLAANANQNAFGKGTTDTWAIMPANNQTFASFDTQYWQGSDVKAGDAVYISGVPGLAAGYYTLLPARYALLPGAMLVSSVSGQQDRTAGLSQVLENGSTLVSGHLASYTANGYTQSSRTGGFVVRSGTDAYKLAQYNTTQASNYFKNNKQAQQVADAGRFSIAATNSLILKGDVAALTGAGGLGAEVDIAAPKLLVVASGEQVGQVIKDGISYLAIDEDTLANFDAASLLLGGTRSNGILDVVSSEVRVSENAEIVAPEVMLAATDTLLLDSGAFVKGAGAGATAKDLVIGAVGGADGDGALIRVSGGKATQITRLNTDANRGELTVESGATVEGDGSLLLDASKKINLAGNIAFADGAALGFSSSHVSLGSPDNNEAVIDGLWLKTAQLDQFVDAGSLFLQSKSTIDLYGDASFGNNSFDLTLQSAGIAGYQNDGKTATITTRNITLANNDNATFAPAAQLGSGTLPMLGTGTLAINAETVVNGNNTVRLAGYDQVNIAASKELVVQGNADRISDLGTPARFVTPNKLVADKNLTINTSRITASNKADYAIESSAGLLKVHSDAVTQPALVAATSKGSELKLTGEQVLLASGATIDMRGAKTSIETTGLNATDNVTLENGARILAQGSAYTLNDQTVALPAGQVLLTSKNGDVDVQQGALIDLTAAGNGDAGKLVVSATEGEAKLAGNIQAAVAGAQGKNATASVDAKIITDVSQTINTLSTFSGAQSYRARQGDMTIAGTDTITAQDVKIVADNGAITINGKIDASGDKGGSIEIFAKDNLTVNAGAELLAKGTADTTSTAGSLGNGGDVLLSSELGIVATAMPDINGFGGALIDVSGDQVGAIKGEGGEVIFRAARTGADAGDGVNVDSAAAAAVTGAKRVLVEAVKKYEYTTIGTTQQTTIRNETNSFATNVAGLMASYSNTRDGLAATIAPGVEVNSATDLTLSADWNLGNSATTPTIPSGGILTLRAGNNLNLNGNIDYEQFNAANILTQRPGSWSYRLVAGADASSVNPEMVVQGTGDIVLANGKFVRTGTGFIHAAAGNDIQLGTNGGLGAAMYTEGLARPVYVSGGKGLMDINTPGDFEILILNNFGVPTATTTNREVYADGGGDVILNAGGEISGSATRAETQNVRSWLYHAALGTNTKNPQARWWSRFNSFTNGVAALGGGDVKVVAGSDVSNLQLAAATNGRMGGDVNAAPDLVNFSELGGGDVSVKAGGSVNQVLLHAGKGDIAVKSGGDINTAVSLMKSSVNLVATDNVLISSVSNPTIGDSAVTGTRKVTFYTYDDQSSVTALSLAGDVAVKGDERVFPSKLSAVAPNGDVDVENVVLYPAAKGNVTLLAGNNVLIDSLIMSEVNPLLLPVINTPDVKTAINPVLSNYQDASGHTAGLLHLDDVNPVRVYAENDIIFKVQSPLVTPKRVEIRAGHDVVDPNIIAQNVKSTDISVIEAGNSIRYNEPVRNGDSIEPTEAGIEIAGPGRLHMIANGDIDLGTSDGVRSVGNLYNPYLGEQGADIMVQPGAAAIADYSGILNAYVEPTSQFSSIYLEDLAVYMRARTGVVDKEKARIAFLEQDAQAQAQEKNQALTDFKLFDKQAQTAFINQVFFNEIREGGRDAIDVKSSSFGDYTRSERAILTMFPAFTTNPNLISQPGSIMQAFGDIANETVTHPGDLNLFYSQIRSERAGRIELLVPGGLVNAGLAVAGNLEKPDTDLGIVSLRGGELVAMVRGDFQVNQSRVFTLGGSDLMLYSALADIDAGKGAKTSSSTPPPVIRIVDGKVIYDYSGSVSGSGIAALTATGGKPGTVDLFAPYGEINAGEAGIRSEGNINLGASSIIGLDNVRAGGDIAGAPAGGSAGLSIATPVSADALASNKQTDQLGDSAKQASNTKLASMPSLISVEVISLGEGSSTNNAITEESRKAR